MLLKTQPNSPVCGVPDTGGASPVQKSSKEGRGGGEAFSRGTDQQPHAQGDDISSTAKAETGQEHNLSDNSTFLHIVNSIDGSNRDAIFKKRTTTAAKNNDIDDKANDDGESDGDRVAWTERRSTPDRGRIMVARMRIPRGTFLYRLTAQAIVCDSDNRTRRCAACLKRIIPQDHQKQGQQEQGQQEKACVCACEGCGEIWYCGRVCKERDGEVLHAAECRFLKALYQGVPTSDLTKKNDNNNDDGGIQDEEVAWMSMVGNPHREAIDRFSRVLDPYSQDYCRVLVRILTHRYHELASTSDGLHSGQAGADPTDPPYLSNQPQAPLPYSCVEDLVANGASFPQERLDGDLRDVTLILDAFQTHLDFFYRHKQQQLHGKQHNATTATGPRRLSQTGLLHLIMREECNSFGLYEYPSPSPSTNTAATPENNAKTGYGLALFVRQYLYGFNHSCSPNLFHIASNFQLFFYAGRDILPGEELNICYLELGPHYRIPPPLTKCDSDVDRVAEAMAETKEAFERRRRFLRGHFHFDCGCARCTWESALYSSTPDAMNGLSEEEERYLREGLSCEQRNCYGFYAPPAVLRARQEDQQGSGQNDRHLDDRWGCVACGHLQA